MIGVGNVAIDVARWLLLDKPSKHTESVVIVARRGPYEVKFDKKEIEHVEAHIDRQDFVAELARIKDRCAHAKQDVSPEKIFATHFPHLSNPGFASTQPRLAFRFLSSPKAFVANDQGRVQQMIVTENDLTLKSEGSTSARSTDATAILDVDTVLFAIGDKHDPQIGLPMGPEGYATRPVSEPGGASFEVWDPAGSAPRANKFVVGWARKASTGLAGVARHDGELGAKKALEYLKTADDPGTLSESEIRARLMAKGIRIVDKKDLALLSQGEARVGPIETPNSFHFNDEMAIFQAIDEERERSATQDTPAISAD